MRVRFGTQNMTEGPVTDALRRCDAVALQEIPHRSAIVGGFGPGWRFYFPEQDPHQCLGWKTSVFDHAGEGESWRFHRSGKADPRIPDKVRTPARYLHMQPLKVEDIKVPVDLYGTWGINSWNPFNPDQWTPVRRWLFVDRTWPVIERELTASNDLGHLALLGGDLNSVRARLGIEGFRSFPRRGLDRQFYPRDPRIKLVNWWFGPKTGRGSQHRHKLLVADYEITKGGK